MRVYADGRFIISVQRGEVAINIANDIVKQGIANRAVVLLDNVDYVEESILRGTICPVYVKGFTSFLTMYDDNWAVFNEWKELYEFTSKNRKVINNASVHYTAGLLCKADSYDFKLQAKLQFQSGWQGNLLWKRIGTQCNDFHTKYYPYI